MRARDARAGALGSIAPPYYKECANQPSKRDMTMLHAVLWTSNHFGLGIQERLAVPPPAESLDEGDNAIDRQVTGPPYSLVWSQRSAGFLGE